MLCLDITMLWSIIGEKNIVSYLILPVLNLEDFVNVRERSGIKLDIKLKVYKAVELSTLLYTCKTWAIYQRLAKILNQSHLRYLTKLLKIQCRNKTEHKEVLKKTGMQVMHTGSKLAQLRWTGHFIRMPDERLPKKVYTDNYRSESALKVARKKNALKATLKASPKDFYILKEILGTCCTQSGAVS